MFVHGGLLFLSIIIIVMACNKLPSQCDVAETHISSAEVSADKAHLDSELQSGCNLFQ